MAKRFKEIPGYDGYLVSKKGVVKKAAHLELVSDLRSKTYRKVDEEILEVIDGYVMIEGEEVSVQVLVELVYGTED